MDERLQQWDTAFFGPWRAIATALGQHGCAVGLIQIKAGPAYLGIALRQLRVAGTPMRETHDLAERLSDQAATAEAFRRRVSYDATRLLTAHQDLIAVTGRLAGDGLASSLETVTASLDEQPASTSA